MILILRWLVWCAAAFGLGLRYRVQVRGLEELHGLKKALILPNHPAYVDPAIVLRVLWPTFRPRPLVFTGAFHHPLVAWLPNVLNAVEVPDLSQHSQEARQQAQHAIDQIVQGLRAGGNHIFWPSGAVSRNGRESLGSARAMAQVIAAVPDAQIVVVRTRGLWGSMFSYARTGRQPNVPRCLMKGLALLAANLVFLMPRRKVEITVERLDRTQFPGLSREQLNPFFENWYNEPGPERPTYVPYHFLLRRSAFEFPTPDADEVLDAQRTKPAIKEVVAQLLEEKLGRELSDAERGPQVRIADLGLDSLDRMELALELERRFGFSVDDVPATLGGLWALAEGIKSGTPAPQPPRNWSRPPSDDQPPKVLADTIPEAFLRRALAHPRDLALADDLSGALTYERLLVGAIVMARRIEKIEGPNIGLLLPASVAINLAILATYLAGKLPVLLNWTTGPANLAHAARVMQLTHVITSKRFVDRTSVEVAGTQFWYLEDLRAGVGKIELLAQLLRVRLAPGTVTAQAMRRVPSPNEAAAVLFTSGSEKAPKAVPLTHRNILSNVGAVLETFAVSRRDVLMGFLPTFHSFGLTVTTVLPVTAGVRVVYHPDPTDAGAIARKIGAYAATLVCGTPTFVSYILDRAKPKDLQSVRLVVVGAEKCPDSLHQRMRKAAPWARLLEGYGITECAPIVACNTPEYFKQGSLGRPLPGIHVKVVDEDTGKNLPNGQMGMLLVAGPNVFAGYLGPETASPFVERDDRRWYVTGDLASLDDEGFIWFSGRLKRFLKAGGEMISLPAIEEVFAQRYPPTDEGPRVAVEGVETPESRKIVLFATVEITLRQANVILADHGLRGIMRLDEVRQLERIPLLGTGKTDYKTLRTWV